MKSNLSTISCHLPNKCQQFHLQGGEVFFCSQNNVLTNSYCLAALIFPTSLPKLATNQYLLTIVFYYIVNSVHRKTSKAINPWIAVQCVGCPPVFTSDAHGKPAAEPQPHTMCFLSSKKCILALLKGIQGDLGLKVFGCTCCPCF